jgi:quercetin dioxygenase-like cupin family protein
MINKIPNISRFNYNNTNNSVYKGSTGEGLPKHEHTFEHTTVCLQGKIIVRREGKELEVTSNDRPLLLVANEWHEIECLEPNTIFINQFQLGMEE